MDTSLSLLPTATAAPTTVSTLAEPAKTSKVQTVGATGGNLALPANKPFVAQVVLARLSGTEFPENPSEIAPANRTLRPYDVPMLPYDAPEKASPATQASQTDTRSAG